MTLLRRFLVLAMLMFWLGGFTFYASVVVPIGKEVLGSHLRQGMITRQVTWYMNLAGIAALAIFALDHFSSGRRWLRWASWAGMAITLVGLFMLHQQLDAMIDPEHESLQNRVAFRGGHRLYLYVMTIQWGFGVVWMIATLMAWRDSDGKRNEGEEKKCPVVDYSGVAQSPKSPADGTT